MTIYAVIFVISGTLMLAFILNGKLGAKRTAEEGKRVQEAAAVEEKAAAGTSKERTAGTWWRLRALFSRFKTASEVETVQLQTPEGKPLKISKSSTLVDFDRFYDGFALTRQGDLVAIMEILPATISTATNLGAFGAGFARVIHALEDNTRLQIVQMPVPNKISSLLDQYAGKAYQWQTSAHKAEIEGDRDKTDRHTRLSAISRLTGYHMIDISARSSRRASFVVIAENATKLGLLTELSVQRAAEKITAKTEQIKNLFLNNGIVIELLSEEEMLETLWYAYNPEAGAAHTSNQMAVRFQEISETGFSDHATSCAVTEHQIEKARTVEHAASEVLSPQYLEPGETHITFNGRRMIFYYVYDYGFSLPHIHDLLGVDNRYGNRLWVSFYITAPKIEEIVSATKKASTGKRAWQELRQRAGVLHSYQQEREIQSIEAAREGSETQENIPRLIGLYLGLMVEDDDELMAAEQIAFESLMNARGLEYSKVRFSTMEAWQTMIPLGQRHLKYRQKPDRNIFAQDIIPLNPVTTTSLIEPGGVFTGYAHGRHGNLSPVALRRMRGDHATADGAYRSPSDAFVGLPGSGKSFAMKFMLTQWQAMGHRAIIIEPKPEFKEVVDVLGGKTVDIAGKGGFNLFNFDAIPNVDPARYKQYGEIVFGDNKAALVTLYSAAKSSGVVGDEISLLTSAMQGTMAEKGMDSKDPTTWGKAEVFLRDIYNYLAHNLRDKSPETVSFMLNVLEQYATPDGQYFEKYNMPSEVELDSELTLMSFGITQFSQDMTSKALSYHFALRVAYQSAVKAFLVGEVTEPVHIIIDEASQMLINGEIVSSIVEMLSLLNTYNISVHLAFQDMAAIQRADSFGLSEAARTTNTLQGMLSTFYLFKQPPASAEISGRVLNLSQDVSGAIPALRTGQCLLAFSGAPIHIPLQIIVPQQLKAMFDTRPEAQKARMEMIYSHK